MQRVAASRAPAVEEHPPKSSLAWKTPREDEVHLRSPGHSIPRRPQTTVGEHGRKRHTEEIVELDSDDDVVFTANINRAWSFKGEKEKARGGLGSRRVDFEPEGSDSDEGRKPQFLQTCKVHFRNANLFLQRN